MQRIKNFGFSVIEVLIVVAILGFLLAGGFSTYKQTIYKSNDAVRKNDLKILSRAFEEYYNNNECYPPLSEWNSIDCKQSGLDKLVKQMPCDPVTGEKYVYQTTNLDGYECGGECGECVGYRILAHLENSTDQSILDIGCHPTRGCGVEVASSSNPNWGLAFGSSVATPDFVSEESEISIAQIDLNPEGSEPVITQVNFEPSLPPEIPEYAIDDPKFFRTFILFTYEDPKFPSNYSFVDVSFREDFGGIVGERVVGGKTFEVYPEDADTIWQYTVASNVVVGVDYRPAMLNLTSKVTAEVSEPYYWKSYVEGCGKTLYWRLHDYHDKTLMSKTYSNVIDCETKVGVISPPNSWYDVYNYITRSQKSYNPIWDLDSNGIIDWNDYARAVLSTKMRAGGWKPPE